MSNCCVGEGIYNIASVLHPIPFHMNCNKICLDQVTLAAGLYFGANQFVWWSCIIHVSPVCSSAGPHKSRSMPMASIAHSLSNNAFVAEP